MNKKRTAKAIFLLWIGSLLGAGFAFLTQVILARRLGSTDFGVFAAALATVNLLVPLAGFGVSQYWLKVFGTEGWSATRWLSASYKYIAFSTVFVLTALIIWALFGPNDKLTTLILIVLSFYVLGQVSMELISAKFQLEEKYAHLAIWQLMPHFARLVAVVLLAYFITKWMGVTNIAYAYACVAAIAIIIGVYQLYRMQQGAFELKGHSKKGNVTHIQNQTETLGISNVISNAWPFGLAGLFQLINYQSDIILVKYITGADAAGMYTVAGIVMAAVYLLPSTIYQKFLLPKMHRWANYDRAILYRVYRQGNVVMLSIGIFAMLGIWATSQWAIPLFFGEQYQEAVVLLNILAVSAPIMFVAFSAGAPLVTQENMKQKVKFMGAVAVINLLLNILLIPSYGAQAAAVTTVFSNLILLSIYFFAAQNIVFISRELGHQKMPIKDDGFIGDCMKSFIKKIRSYGRLISALNGFLYDYSRFCLFSAWRSDMKDAEQRNYNAVKIYHSLEKSMSLKNRRSGAGQSAAYLLLDVLKYAKESNDIGFHDKAALSILSRFIELDGNNKTEWSEQIRKALLVFDFFSDEVHGFQMYGLEDFREGMLENPEKFFLSRYSLREFKNEIVPEHVVKRAVALALKTPSVCNRQAWHVYHTDSKNIINVALKYQTGNKGFGDTIPNLMIIASDLKAFMSGNEHYQHWIDGGMFTMSLIYALHSLGVASCCLNWSQSPANDKLLRSFLDIKPNHTVTVMLAIGWPNEQNNVCVSARRPLDEVFSSLRLKKGQDR